MITLPATVLLENDLDPEGQTLTIVSASSATPGFTAAVLSNGAVQVTAPVGYTGLADLSYTISDEAGGTASATVSLGYIENVAPVLNGAPLPAIETPQASPFTLTLPIDLFIDPDGHSLVYTARLQGGGALPAWLAYDADTRMFSGTPPVNFQGTHVIEIIASDSERTGSTTFDLIVTSLGDPPVAMPDGGFETVLGAPLVIAPAALLANDSDPDQTLLTIASVSAAAGGSVALSATSQVVFTPAAGYVGPVSFTYEIVDGNGDTASAGVSLDVIWGPVGGVTYEGSSADNNIVGTSGRDVIAGGGGNDIINGLGGDDVFLTSWRPGFVRYIGGTGFDRVQGSDADDIIGITGVRQALVGIEAVDGGRGYDVLLLADTNVNVDLSVINLTRVELIQGGAGFDIIVSSLRDDVIGGGANRDRFQFVGSFGHDTITDFVPDTMVVGRGDSLELVGQEFTSFADVMSHTIQDGTDTVITVGANTIRLLDVAKTSLIAADFVL